MRLDGETQRPIIGISAHFRDENSMINDAYVQAVVRAGGIPVVLPVVTNSDVIRQMVEPLDGLLMSGGGDMDPELWGEKIMPQSGVPNRERDDFDLLLIRECHYRQKPILGICRGMQAINVAFGGSLYQDIYSQIQGTLLVHDQSEPKRQATHAVTVTPNSLLHRLVKEQEIQVNTIHHQAVKEVADGFDAVAFATDGVCEAIESRYYPIIGVQWHPEHLALAEMTEAKVLFEYLIKEAILYRKATDIHKKMITLDSHTDTPMVWYEGIDLGKRQKETQVDFVKMRQGGVDATFMVAYIAQQPLSDSEAEAAHEKAVQILENLKAQIDAYPNEVALALEPSELLANKVTGKLSIGLGIENGYALGNRIEALQEFYNQGVRYITLCHNGDNSLCDSCRGMRTHNGLSEFGKEVVAEMNRLGMLIDIAHAADSTIDQTIALSSKPVVSTHSCSRALCNSKRNLTNAQLKALAEKGGVCQICLYAGFLENQENATIDTVLEHIAYMVQLVGIDHIGIGSDFDGGGGIPGCMGSHELINITKALILAQYSEIDIAKIMGGNFLRVWKENMN